MLKEIKIHEQHWTSKNQAQAEEIKNSNNTMGSLELENLDKKYKHLISTDLKSFDCRTYPNVTITIRTYLFSSLKNIQI
jgi:hypothetical protein